ncbi:purple acid phosphatase family protein [Megasphaera vaginalis (ex Bordigoni et al. 2020)]|uniref:purple acid phosphatase family protein n=1 Tax=Megasphaera vaginalis (ex Bordigoni et al. 2020) TaxID=2045301 RepID=UPI001F343CB8|nr:metallophosphoesterase family protein [Megasphaera vaginalis (ex Bordigoni et al. 2020)]
MVFLSKRTYLSLAAVAVIAAVGTYLFVPGAKTVTQQTLRATKAAAAHYELLDAVDAVNIRQVITADSTTSRTIMWQSAVSEPDAVVDYRVNGDETVRTLPAAEESFTDNGQTTFIHRALIKGLTAGTEYEYRIGTNGKRSPWFPLKTASGTAFKALIYPDSQSSDYAVWTETARAAWQRNGDASFFINMGDLVDNGQDTYQWNAWFEAVENMIAAIPVVPLVGNHETYDKNWQVCMPETYLHLFALPDNGNKAYANQFYSFDYGNVHFIVLNTQFSELADFEPSLEADEITWFKEDVARSEKKWKVVLMHKDPLQYAFNPEARSTPREEGFSEEGKTFMPLFDAAGIDVVLSAHLHTYRNRGHIKNFRRDDAGPLYILTGVAGNVRYPSLWKQHALDEYLAPQPETDNYLTLEATDDSLRFQAFLPDGTLLDTAEVRK